MKYILKSITDTKNTEYIFPDKTCAKNAMTADYFEFIDRKRDLYGSGFLSYEINDTNAYVMWVTESWSGVARWFLCPAVSEDDMSELASLRDMTEVLRQRNHDLSEKLVNIDKDIFDIGGVIDKHVTFFGDMTETSHSEVTSRVYKCMFEELVQDICAHYANLCDEGW